MTDSLMGGNYKASCLRKATATRLLKKSASSVLASFRGSTLRQTSSEIGNTRGTFSVCQELLRRANGYT